MVFVLSFFRVVNYPSSPPVPLLSATGDMSLESSLRRFNGVKIDGVGVRVRGDTTSEGSEMRFNRSFGVLVSSSWVLLLFYL